MTTESIKKTAAALLSAVTLCTLLPLSPAAEEADPDLVITEVCFNPTYLENDPELSKSEDVLEYVEICNVTDKEISLADCVLRYAKNYDTAPSENPVVALSDNPRTLAPGETAVFVCYQESSAILGYGYATDEEIRAYYDFFCTFYDCADLLTPNRFYVIPRVASGTGNKLEGGFNLANSHTEAVIRLARGEEILAECFYNAELWNKNGTAVNMMWHAGMEGEHPTASRVLNTAGCTPGRIYANQVPNAALTPTGETLSVQAMVYNLQAEAKNQTAADGSTVTDEMRTARIYEIVGEKDPDVMVLTEINFRWLGLLPGNLIGEGGKYSAYGRSAKGKYHDGDQLNDKWDLTSLVLWKTEKYDCIEKGTFWCSMKPDRPGSATWEGGLTGDLPRAINWVILQDKATGAQFVVAGAHLDAKSADIRALSTALIREQLVEIADGLPTVIMGDFNCSDNSAAYGNILSDELYDARYLVPAYGDMTVLGTYNKFGENTDLQVRLPIDLCFVSPATVWVRSASMEKGFVDEGESVYASDHNAVVFGLELAKLTRTAETEPVTEPATDPATEPATLPEETTVPPATETSVESDDTVEDNGGCASALSLAAVTAWIPAALALGRRSKRRQEE